MEPRLIGSMLSALCLIPYFLCYPEYITNPLEISVFFQQAAMRYLKIVLSGKVWGYKPVTPSVEKLRWDDHEFEVSLDYVVNSRPV